MPTISPTGYETYIYDHREFPGVPDDPRQFQGPLHDPVNLPPPECDLHRSPLIMIEPSGATGSDEVWIHFRIGPSMMLPRLIAEQLRDALVKVCEKPKVVSLDGVKE